MHVLGSNQAFLTQNQASYQIDERAIMYLAV